MIRFQKLFDMYSCNHSSRILPPRLYALFIVLLTLTAPAQIAVPGVTLISGNVSLANLKGFPLLIPEKMPPGRSWLQGR